MVIIATDPIFAATVQLGTALLGAVETNLQIPTTTSVIVTAATNGTKIEEIVIQATTTSLVASTVAGLVYVFLYDGSTYHLFDTVTVTAITASASVKPFRASVKYDNLIMKTGWSLRASQSNTTNASILKFTALGGDF